MRPVHLGYPPAGAKVAGPMSASVAPLPTAVGLSTHGEQWAWPWQTDLRCAQGGGAPRGGGCSCSWNSSQTVRLQDAESTVFTMEKPVGQQRLAHQFAVYLSRDAPEPHTQIRNPEPLSEDDASVPRWSSVNTESPFFPSSMQPPYFEPPPNPTRKPATPNLTREPKSYSPDTTLAPQAMKHEPSRTLNPQSTASFRK